MCSIRCFLKVAVHPAESGVKPRLEYVTDNNKKGTPRAHQCRENCTLVRAKRGGGGARLIFLAREANPRPSAPCPYSRVLFLDAAALMRFLLCCCPPPSLALSAAARTSTAVRPSCIRCSTRGGIRASRAIKSIIILEHIAQWIGSMFTWTLDFRPQIDRMRVLLFTELPKLLGLLTQRILAPMHDVAGSVFGSISRRHRALPSATAVGVGRRTEWLFCRTASSFPGRYGRCMRWCVCVCVVTAASAASTAAVSAW